MPVPPPIAAVEVEHPLRARLSEKFKNYHLGCGPIIADGFLNIDGDFASTGMQWKEEVVYVVEDRPTAHFLRYDLRKGIPALSGSLDVIYHSHLFEHLSEEEGVTFLQDCQRVLAPDGVMRLAVPDFGLWCTNYAAGEDAFFDWYRRTYLDDDRKRYGSRGAVFAAMLFKWGHRMAYDFDALSARLTTAGFVDVTRCDWGVSSALAAISAVELAGDDRRLESLVVECRKAPGVRSQ
jgi:predicted SAM-dependent methyltransferase